MSLLFVNEFVSPGNYENSVQTDNSNYLDDNFSVDPFKNDPELLKVRVINEW